MRGLPSALPVALIPGRSRRLDGEAAGLASIPREMLMVGPRRGDVPAVAVSVLAAVDERAGTAAELVMVAVGAQQDRDMGETEVLHEEDQGVQ